PRPPRPRRRRPARAPRRRPAAARTVPRAPARGWLVRVARARCTSSPAPCFSPWPTPRAARCSAHRPRHRSRCRTTGADRGDRRVTLVRTSRTQREDETMGEKGNVADVRPTGGHVPVAAQPPAQGGGGGGLLSDLADQAGDKVTDIGLGG